MFFAWKYRDEVRKKFEALLKGNSDQDSLAVLDTEMVVIEHNFRKRKSEDNHSPIIKLTKTDNGNQEKSESIAQ
jgi:hypothetical protein